MKRFYYYAALPLLVAAVPLAAQRGPERATDGVTVTAGGETLLIHWFAPSEESLWHPTLEAVARKHGGPAPSSCTEAMAVARDQGADAPHSYGAYCARMGGEALPVKVCWDDSMAGYAISTLVEKQGLARSRRALAAFVAVNCWGD